VVEFDELVGTQQRTLGPTDFMVTHDLDSLYSICDRVTALADGRVAAAGSMETMLPSRHPWLQAYFHGVRGGRLTGALAKNKDDAWKPAPISR
jgi:phospholipid/cholesterol/gamma-HCH transport system ATP-binding protein